MSFCEHKDEAGWDCKTLGTGRATLRLRVREVEGVINNEEKNI